MPRKPAVIPERTPQDWLDLIAELERERTDRAEAAEGIRAERRTLGAALAIGDSDASARHRALGADLAEQAARLEEIEDAITGAQGELEKARRAEARTKRHERARKILELCDERERLLNEAEPLIDRLADLLMSSHDQNRRLQGFTQGAQKFERHWVNEGSGVWLARLWLRVVEAGRERTARGSDTFDPKHVIGLTPSLPSRTPERQATWRRTLDEAREHAEGLLAS